jgi:hypothetical protein
MFGRGRQFQSYAFSNLPGKALDGTKLQRRLRALLVVFYALKVGYRYQSELCFCAPSEASSKPKEFYFGPRNFLSHDVVTCLTAFLRISVHPVGRRKVSPPHGSNDAFYAL